jgi:hypothetical protein
MLSAHHIEVLPQSIADPIRQHDSPILLALSAPDGDLPPLEIDVLDAQFETLLEAQTASSLRRL